MKYKQSQGFLKPDIENYKQTIFNYLSCLKKILLIM